MSGCEHSFSWTSTGTGQTEPPEWTISTCPRCGTSAQWRDGSWHVSTPTAGAMAMEEAERRGEALQQIIAVLGPEPHDCPVENCAGCQWEMDEAVRIAKEAFGLV